ncbi:uncharacterized protein [Pyxicephalus adspersus]|uniref:uncharacterized protein n=1 Tax=Pyxicephalus adspersus TaxID=30357 RepID=UPI003B594477
MLINTNMGSRDGGGVCELPPTQYNDLPTLGNLTSPKIPAPPPPPPPIQAPGDPPLPRFDPKRRLRNFNWEAIPLEKVKGRSSLWSSETFQGDLQIDTGTMEELFGKHEEEVQARLLHPRRSLSMGDAHGNKVFLLDSRRSMNIGILLKQFKRPPAQIAEDIRMGKADTYSLERLTELLKLLPDRDEVQRLRSFQGGRERLSEADLFMLLLLDVPSYSLRLETLILKKDFQPAIVSLLSAARELKTAADELLHCSELHFILKLVLKAGNFMNAGGYAGNAAGFRVSSLLKLADTKANKPGMNLLHFVVMEVQKKDPKYLSFADTLKHVQSGSRLSEENLLEEFDKLQLRVTTMRKNLFAPEQRELRQQMEEFLEYAEEQLQEVQKEMEELQSSKQNLAEFLCEDEDTFHLEECCRIFWSFCLKFQMAIKENKVRELEEQRRQQWERKRLQKRHSMATCGSLEARQAVDDLELTLERNLQNLRRTPSLRVCRMRSLGSYSPNPYVPQSEQRERIQVYCDQKNAEQMREMSQRVLRQQMEYKSSISPHSGPTTNFFPESKIPTNSSSQSADKSDGKISPAKDRTEIPHLLLEIEDVESLDEAQSQPVRGETQQKPPHSQLRDQCMPILPGIPLSSKVEICTQTEITDLTESSLDHSGLDISGGSQHFLEAAKPRPPFGHLITSKGTNQSPLDLNCYNEQSPCQSKSSILIAASQSLTHPMLEMHYQMPLTSLPNITRQGMFPQCTCGVIIEEPNAGLETQQPQAQPTIPPYPSKLETFKPTHSDPQNFTQSSIKPPECSRIPPIKPNGQALNQQETLTWNEQRDLPDSQISKQLPDKELFANKSQTQDQSAVDLLDLESLCLSAPRTSRLPGNGTISEAPEQPPASNIPKARQASSDLDSAIQSDGQPDSETLSRPAYVSEEQLRPVASITTFNQHKLGHFRQISTLNITKPSTETLTPDESETLPHTLIHLHPEDDSPRQSALKIPKQYSVKSFKQTLVKSAPKNPRQSVAPAVPPKSNPSLIQTRSESSNPNQPKAELSRISKPGCFMSRIKHVEHLSVKQPTKDINGQVPQNVVEPQHEAWRGPQHQDMEYNYCARGSIHREAPNPCSKWKRELRKASENADGCRVELKVENSNMEHHNDNTEQKAADNPKNSALGRNGSNASKKVKNDLGMRKVLNKDGTLGSISSSKPPASTKQQTTETTESKIPQKPSARSTKPPLTKTMGGLKEKRDRPRSNSTDSGKSERRNSPMVTRHPAVESPGHCTEQVKEPVWPSKKNNSVARVAIHVIKHYEVNSTLTRGSRSPYLTTHPVWR